MAPGSANPDPRVIIYNGFDARIRTPGSACHRNFIDARIRTPRIRASSWRRICLTGSNARIRTPRIRASSWGRIFLTGSDARIRTSPDPRVIMEKNFSDSDARIRTPGSARHQKIDCGSDVRIHTPGSARHKIF